MTNVVPIKTLGVELGTSYKQNNTGKPLRTSSISYVVDRELQSAYLKLLANENWTLTTGTSVLIIETDAPLTVEVIRITDAVNNIGVRETLTVNQLCILDSSYTSVSITANANANVYVQYTAGVAMPSPSLAGAVLSVNSVNPDGNGNVSLTVSNIQGAIPEAPATSVPYVRINGQWVTLQSWLDEGTY